MRKKVCLLPLMFLIILVAACQKDKADPTSSIFGEWLFVNAQGGFTGHQVINPNGKEIYAFYNDSTFKKLRNDTILAQGTFHIGSEKSIFTNAPAANINFSSTVSLPSMLITIKNDSLNLITNHVEPFGYLYTRVK